MNKNTIINITMQYSNHIGEGYQKQGMKLEWPKQSTAIIWVLRPEPYQPHHS